MKIENLDVQYEKEQVFLGIDCYADSPVYADVEEEYEALRADVDACMDARACYAFGELRASYGDYAAGTKAVFVFISVGKAVSLLSAKMFAEGNYLAGLLVDSMADCALMKMDAGVMDEIVKACKKKGVGIKARLEAPSDIPIQIQAEILAQLGEEAADVSITEGFMYNPVKSTGILLLLTDEEVYNTNHDCSSCSAVNCKFRKEPNQITMIKDGQEQSLTYKPSETVFDLLRAQGIHVTAPCGGNGRCGKCRIKMIEGATAPSAADYAVFSEEELKEGMRLACTAKLTGPCVISVEGEREFEVLAAPQSEEIGDEHYGIAIDIGTTTIAMQLIGLTKKTRGATYTTINRQSIYGADVVSRMQAANDGHLQELSELIRADLQSGIERLMQGKPGRLERIVIAANTTMLHLLRGYSCETLGVYPFTPVTIKTEQFLASELFRESGWHTATITLLPGISTYVGADVVAGIYASQMQATKQNAILIDLGTNGEMAIKANEKLLCTSAAAGPAFEGGNILCGTGSIFGAISHVALTVDGGDVRADIDTIADEAPVGICGTGVVDMVAELVRCELIDETGLLHEDYFEDGICLAKKQDGKEIVFVQKDVREIQLAKAAIRAAIEVMLLRTGSTKESIDTVYLAGGFGYRMDVEKAIRIGLLPEEFCDKVKSLGNTSLEGAVLCLMHDDAVTQMERIASSYEEISLSTDAKFNALYMDCMYFEEE